MKVSIITEQRNNFIFFLQVDKLSQNLNNVTIDKEVLKIQLKDKEEIKVG